VPSQRQTCHLAHEDFCLKNWATEKMERFVVMYVSTSGVDVLITMFCDFCHFWRKIGEFFSTTNVTIKFLQKPVVV
jgi:hypothetical protein